MLSKLSGWLLLNFKTNNFNRGFPNSCSLCSCRKFAALQTEKDNLNVLINLLYEIRRITAQKIADDWLLIWNKGHSQERSQPQHDYNLDKAGALEWDAPMTNLSCVFCVWYWISFSGFLTRPDQCGIDRRQQAGFPPLYTFSRKAGQIWVLKIRQACFDLH